MGFLLGGPFFHLKGRTGNNVGRVVKGRNVFSMRPTPSEKPPTVLQLGQQMRFGLFTNWLSWVTPVLNIGFAKFDAKMSPFNAAVSYNIKHAVTGVSPNFSRDYSKVLFSRGHRDQLSDPVITAAADAVVNVTWDSVLLPDYAEATDMVTLVVYNVALDRFIVQMDVAVRSAEMYELQLPLPWEGDLVHVWNMVTGAGDVSDTQYIGQLTVVA